MSNTLEKVAHQYHMHEIYMRAAEMYQEMEKDSTLDRTFCSCANDIVANGVLAELAGWLRPSSTGLVTGDVAVVTISTTTSMDSWPPYQGASQETW